jgi:tetratricopeptide (TPR) repeat protein
MGLVTVVNTFSFLLSKRMKRPLSFALLGVALGVFPQRPRAAEGTPPGTSTTGMPSLDPRAKAVQDDLAAGQMKSANRKAHAWVKTDKRSADAWTTMGRVALADNRPRRALSYFTRALKYAPHHAPAFLGRGQCFEKRGRLDEAANEYRAAALADASLADAQTALARLHDQATLPE